MYDHTNERVTIDETIAKRLETEKHRTSLGPGKILRYMRLRGLMPEDAKLQVVQLENWINGLSKTARKVDIDAILNAYAEITPESELITPPEGGQLILICDALDAELRGMLAKRSNSCRRALLKAPDTPKGLTENRLKRLAAGQDKVIRASNLHHIRAALSSLQDA